LYTAAASVANEVMVMWFWGRLL